MAGSIALIVGGLFACYGLIVSKAKSIKDEFDAIMPLQRIAGGFLIFFFLKSLFTIGGVIQLLSNKPLLGILEIVSIVTMLVLGFILTYGIITKYVLTAPTDAKEKTDNIYKKLTLVQVPFGIIAICIGLIGIFFHIIY